MSNARKTPKTWTRDPQKERFWRRTLSEYIVSGLSIREFCRQRNLSYASFGAWKRELQNRDRERSASGVADPGSLLPALPQSVRDRRGRVIPARFRKWLEETKALPQTQIPSSPFVPLKLVETAELRLEKEAPINSQVEILSPSQARQKR